MLTPENENTLAKSESIATIASGIVDDARKLVQLEVQLAATIFRQEVERAGKALTLLLGGLVLAIPAVLLASLAIAEGLHALTDWPAWICQAIVAVAFLVAAGLTWKRAAGYRRGA